ncbi:2,4'-dihydroxyacetophenone dioxygenase family protein [Rhodococcus qingshengii]|uniref:2,4'-dihydroxyacetophenone dioxygenase family protein n=1 Tax=Rhodococcus qingshengii TaxID=334542 RepID=UPI00237C5374|nr:2,4'-dihydroxyacetophenone dioxygenase family protein [Rhodococcus qingshengii]WCT06053.1 2,4'-dihydroxyacetophenone dioxygenase family protein [Rhodococcus qingshengii]
MSELLINKDDITLNDQQKLDDVALRYQLPDIYAPADESYSPWMFVEGSEGMWARYLWFDLRLGQWGAMVRSDGPGVLGRHKHRSGVLGYTVRGTWGYEEYDWEAGAGDVVVESPGVIHTLRSTNPEGFETFFVLNGSIDWYDEDNNVVLTEDTFYNVHRYEEYCKANGLPINDALFRR